MHAESWTTATFVPLLAVYWITRNLHYSMSTAPEEVWETFWIMLTFSLTGCSDYHLHWMQQKECHIFTRRSLSMADWSLLHAWLMINGHLESQVRFMQVVIVCLVSSSLVESNVFPPLCVDYGLEALHKHSFEPRCNTFEQVSSSTCILLPLHQPYGGSHAHSFPSQISASNQKPSIASGVCLLDSSPSQATDIYSYGVILKELAATQRPSLGEVEWEIYWAWKEQLTNNEQEYDENTPKKFIKVCFRSWSWLQWVSSLKQHQTSGVGSLQKHHTPGHLI